MNVENIKVGETYTYRELCDLLGVEYSKAANKKVPLLEKFESYFEFESFAKEFDTEKLELKNYVNALKRNKPNYDIKVFASEYAKERTPFLLQKDVEDILENSKLKESEKNIYNSSARIFEKCLKNGSVKYGQFTYKLDERFILRRC